MYNTIKTLVIYLSLGLAFSCQKLDPQAPVIEESNEVITPKLSTIQLPLIFPISDIETLINTKLPDTLVNDQSFENQQDHLKLVITKIGNVEINMIGHELSYAIPLNVHVGLQTKFKKEIKTDFSLILKMKSELTIASNWHLTPHTQLQEIYWIEKPKVKIAFFHVGITKIVEKVIQDKVPSLLPVLDQALADKLPIKEEVSKIWNDIQKPILINKDLKPIWLKATPQQVYLQTFGGNIKELKLDLVIESFIELFPSEQKPQITLVALGSLSQKQVFSKGFQIYALARLPFTELNGLLKNKLKGKVIQIEGYEVTIKKAKLAGGKGKIYLETHIQGATKGVLHFTGTPAIDSLNMVLNINDLDFDVNTQNVLVESADWLLHNDFKTRVQEELHLPLKEHIQKIPLLIEQGIGNSKLGNKLKVTFSDFMLSPKELIVNNQEIQLLVKVEGDFDLEIDLLKASIPQ